MAEEGKRRRSAEDRSPIASIKFNGLEKGKAAVAWMHNRVQETLQVSSSAFCNSPTPLPISFVFSLISLLCISLSLSLPPPRVHRLAGRKTICSLEGRRRFMLRIGLTNS